MSSQSDQQHKQIYRKILEIMYSNPSLYIYIYISVSLCPRRLSMLQVSAAKILYIAKLLVLRRDTTSQSKVLRG